MARRASRKHSKKIPTTIPKEMRKLQFCRKDAFSLLFVITISLFLNLLGFGWGMDGQVPWAADGIEGVTTVREMPKLFGKWTYKYPRLQFLIDGLCYKPLIKNWEKNPVYTIQNGKQRVQVLTRQRMNILARISRINILIMSTLIIIFVYLIAKFYYADSLAAFFASLSLSLCFVFVYYSHTTCVDIPSMLWVTMGVYFLIRSVYLNNLLNHVLMAIAFAFAACTKDAMLFYAVAFVITYIGLRIHLQMQDGTPFKKCLPEFLNRNTILAIVVFLFVFALLQNILFSPKAYWDRMGVWVGGRGVKDFNQGFKGHLPQLWNTLKLFYWALGWPLVILVLTSLVFTMKKHRFFNILLVLFPVVFFYVFISMRIKMSFIRYYLPVMGLLFLPVGVFLSGLFTTKKKVLLRTAVPVASLFFVLSFMYCIALDLEFINDSRNQTAEWFKSNVPPNTPVISLANRPYGPKLTKHGYPTIENWKVPPLNILLQNLNQFPDYLVMSTQWYTIKTKEAKAFRQALVKNRGGYSEVALFRHKGYLNPRKNLLSIACWPVVPTRAVSPNVIVMKKETSR